LYLKAHQCNSPISENTAFNSNIYTQLASCLINAWAVPAHPCQQAPKWAGRDTAAQKLTERANLVEIFHIALLMRSAFLLQ